MTQEEVTEHITKYIALQQEVTTTIASIPSEFWWVAVPHSRALAVTLYRRLHNCTFKVALTVVNKEAAALAEPTKQA